MIKKIILEIKVLLGIGKWYKVFNSIEAALANIPDKKAILVHMGNTEICLTRNSHKITAFLNVCPHHQMPLNRGSFNDKQEWICPYHRHCFNLDHGKNMTMPETKNLEIFSIKTSKKGIFVYKPNEK